MYKDNKFVYLYYYSIGNELKQFFCQDYFIATWQIFIYNTFNCDPILLDPSVAIVHFPMPYNFFFTIALGVLPSIAWLFFYLRKDIHPEPKKWLMLVFLSGMAITPLAIVTEWKITDFFNFLNSSFPDLFGTFLKNIAMVFFAIATVEEFFKYLIVRLAMKHNPVFDEPEDAMIYMIVAALGFAAVENIIVMYSLSPILFVDPIQPLYILGIRFIGATFLHTLASAIIGFYYALSLCKNDKYFVSRRSLVAKGFVIAILLHGIFDYFILVLNEASMIYFSIPLFAIAVFVLYDFKILQGISPNKFNNS